MEGGGPNAAHETQPGGIDLEAEPASVPAVPASEAGGGESAEPEEGVGVRIGLGWAWSA